MKKAILLAIFGFIYEYSFPQQINVKYADISIIGIDTCCLPDPPRDIITCFSYQLDTISIIINKGLSLDCFYGSIMCIEKIYYIKPYKEGGVNLYTTDWYVDRVLCFPSSRNVYILRNITFNN